LDEGVFNLSALRVTDALLVFVGQILVGVGGDVVVAVEELFVESQEVGVFH
jgi:hypothetical protein